MSASAALLSASPSPEPDPALPDRTPRSMAVQSKRRVQKTCIVCSAPFLVSSAASRSYQTCSRACSRTLLRSQRQGRPQGGRRRAVREKPASVGPSAQDLAQRPDIVPKGRAALLDYCICCGGLRGQWGRHEVPPPELCYRCLMRRNAGFDDGVSMARGDV